MKGSVFPRALSVGLPCAILTAIFKYLTKEYNLDGFNTDDSVLRDNAAWSGFSFLVGFLIVFRTSQAYNRFWDGCIWTHQMRAEWFDACSSVVAFCKFSTVEDSIIANFKELLVRLFSMLHAAALADIEDSTKSELEAIQAFHMDLIDPCSLDHESLLTLKHSDCKVEVLFQWIQQVIIENIKTGVLTVPAPILSRSFQEIANGMLAFHQAIKISYIPFPFPYAQICDTLLIMHYCVVPILSSQWTTEPAWAGLFAFMQVFILWSLNFIAVEIENPFGMDENDLDAAHMQDEMNQHLRVLLKPEVFRSPHLNIRVADCAVTKSFIECWNEAAETPEALARSATAESMTDIGIARSVRASYHSSSPNCPNARIARGLSQGSKRGSLVGRESRGGGDRKDKPFRPGHSTIQEDHSECTSDDVGSEVSHSHKQMSLNDSYISEVAPSLKQSLSQTFPDSPRSSPPSSEWQGSHVLSPPQSIMPVSVPAAARGNGTAARHNREGLNDPTCAMSLRGVADDCEDRRVTTTASSSNDDGWRQGVPLSSETNLLSSQATYMPTTPVTPNAATPNAATSHEISLGGPSSSKMNRTHPEPSPTLSRVRD